MQEFETHGIFEPRPQSDEEILWSGRARFSRRPFAVAFLGLFALGCLVCFAVLGEVLLAMSFGLVLESAIVILGPFFAFRGSRYHITDRRILVRRADRVRGSVPLEDVRTAVITKTGFLGVASLNVYHYKNGLGTWFLGGTPQDGEGRPVHCLSLGLLGKTEAEEAEQVALQAKYAKDKGLI